MRNRLGLWTGLLGAPLAWVVTFDVDDALMPFACAWDQHAALHLLRAFGIGAILVAALLSWRSISHATSRPDGGPGLGRRRFLTLAGLGSSVLFALVVFAADVPVLVPGACP